MKNGEYISLLDVYSEATKINENVSQIIKRYNNRLAKVLKCQSVIIEKINCREKRIELYVQTGDPIEAISLMTRITITLTDSGPKINCPKGSSPLSENISLSLLTIILNLLFFEAINYTDYLIRKQADLECLNKNITATITDSEIKIKGKNSQVVKYDYTNYNADAPSSLELIPVSKESLPSWLLKSYPLTVLDISRQLKRALVKFTRK